MMLLVPFLILVLLLGIIGCDDDESTPTPTPTATAVIGEATPTPISTPMPTEEGEPTITPTPMPTEESETEMTLTSTAFQEGGSIPQEYSCDGVDISPLLQWSNVPDGVQSFALIMDDPDAPVGTWIHWVIYNIPGDKDSLQEAIPSDANLGDGSKQGVNSWEEVGYGGPCPPIGEQHRYYFKLYALDEMLDLPIGLTKTELLNAMDGHVVAQAELMGLYSS